MKSDWKMVMGLLIISAVGAFSPPSFAQFNPSQTKPSTRAVEPRTIMHSGFNRTTGLVEAVTVDEGPMTYTAQVLPWGRRGEIVGKGDATRQSEQALENLMVALKVSGAMENSVAKINVCVADPETTPKVLAVIRKKINFSSQPAVSFVTGNLTHPDALVAMDGVAEAEFEPDGHEVKRARVPALAAVLDTAAATMPGGARYYVSGQAKNGPLPDAVRGTLASLEKTLTFLGLKKSDVVQMRAFMQPISSADSVQAEIVKFFSPELPPPAVFVEWSSPTNTPIEIELIAADNKPAKTTGDLVDFITPPDLNLSKVFSRVAHVNRGRTIYFSALYGAGPVNSAGQVNDIFVNLDNLLPRAGTDFNHLVKATYYVADSEASDKLNEIRPKFFNADRPPAASKAMVKGVGFPDKTVAVDMIAVAK